MIGTVKKMCNIKVVKDDLTGEELKENEYMTLKITKPARYLEENLSLYNKFKIYILGTRYEYYHFKSLKNMNKFVSKYKYKTTCLWETIG